MLIRREDLDPLLVDRFLAGIAASFAKPNPSPEERRIQGAERARFQPDFRQWLPWMLSVCGLGIAVGMAPMTRGMEPAASAVILGGPVLLMLGMGIAGFVTMMRGFKSRLNVLHSDLLAGWMPFLDLSRAERAYCETLTLLGKPDLKVDEPTARAILSDMNSLLEQSRHLDEQRLGLVGGSASTTVAALQAEQASLTSRLASAEDPEARTHLEQSLLLCAAREQNARALAPAVERVEAHQERIIQTFGSIQGTLSRLETAHQALSTPDVDEIQRRLNEVTSDVLATESAVQEVLHLRQSA